MRLTSPKKLLKHKMLEDLPQGYTSRNNGLEEITGTSFRQLEEGSFPEVPAVLGWAF